MSAIGTAKALEMGEIKGAMSGLSIAVSGVFTVIGASVFAQFCAVYIKISRLRKKPRYFSVIHVFFKYCAGIRLDLILIFNGDGAERDLVAPHAVIKLDPCFEP